MNITCEKREEFTILTITGRVDTINSPLFEEEIEKVFASGEKDLVFDCSGIDYISSSGLRIFLIAWKRAMAMKGSLGVCCLQPAVREIFDISGFSAIFTIFDTRDAALEER